MQRIDHTDDYGELRRAEYPSESEQLHAVVKGIKALMAGEPVPDDALAVIELVDQVKAKYPKEATDV